MIHHQIGIPFAKNVNALLVVVMMMMMMEMMVEMMKVDVNLPVILPKMPIVMMETTTKDATGMVVLAALEMIHHQIGIPFAKNVNALVVVMMMMMMMEMMVEMMKVDVNLLVMMMMMMEMMVE